MATSREKALLREFISIREERKGLAKKIVGASPEDKELLQTEDLLLEKRQGELCDLAAKLVNARTGLHLVK